MNPTMIVAAVAAIAFLGWLAWISIQSVLQARLLRDAADAGMSDYEPGRRAAIHGEVQLFEPLRKADLGNLLWYRCKTEELSGWGKRRRWRTVGDFSEMAIFGIRVMGREVRVEGLPTEVQSAQSRVERPDSGGLDFFSMGGNRKTTESYIPVLPRMTVVGRLEQRDAVWVVVVDTAVGLLLSPEEPRQAASKELLKGVLGLAAVAASVVAGLIFFLQSR